MVHCRRLQGACNCGRRSASSYSGMVDLIVIFLDATDPFIFMCAFVGSLTARRPCGGRAKNVATAVPVCRLLPWAAVQK